MKLLLNYERSGYMYLKITNQEENHNDLQYHTGLVEDIIPFQREGSCVAGGIYYTTQEYICGFLGYGIWLREVTIPEDAEYVKDPGGDKWRANKVILGERKDLRKVETWRWLVEECNADIHVLNENALRWASNNGRLEVVKYLVEKCHADIHVDNEYAVRWASGNGHIEVVKYLVQECKVDIHVGDEEAVKLASYGGYLEVVKYLVEECHADIHVKNENAIRWASENGQLEVVKYLESIK
jgi:hypothetical protein